MLKLLLLFYLILWILFRFLIVCNIHLPYEQNKSPFDFLLLLFYKAKQKKRKQTHNYFGEKAWKGSSLFPYPELNKTVLETPETMLYKTFQYLSTYLKTSQQNL